MKILVVDDEGTIRSLCLRALSAAGHEVRAVASGEEALKTLTPELDLVLTDLTMPGSLGGIEVAQGVKAAGSGDVILMTGHPELDTALAAMREGVYDYLIKPFSLASLVRTVERCAEKRRLSKELAREKALRTELERAHQELTLMGRVRETFGQFATPQVAQLMLADPAALKPGGKRRQVTVLFADVRGFTRFAREVPPEEAVAAINGIFAVLIDDVQAAGGIVNKFIGDGVMALFNAPLALPDHALAAARAALKAMKTLESQAASRRASGLAPLHVGMGLNTGEVVAGCLGTSERAEYSVIGHAVNVASRLEAVAAPGQILVGPETGEALKGRFHFRGHGLLELAGVAEPVNALELLA